MSDTEKKAPEAEEPKQSPAETELSDADLDNVAGGLNPQPLPPGRSFT